jgi:predicted DNA-binding transcriptional regulator AlpA
MPEISNTALAQPTPVAPALAQFDQLPDSAHVRLPVVCGLRGVGPATVWRHAKLGLIPKPKKLGPNVTAWNVGELRRSMAAAAEA